MRWCGRASVISLLGYAPWIYGMVTWNQQLLLLPWITAIIAFTCLAAILDSRQRISLNPFLLSLLCLIVFAIIQLIPLPESVFQLMAPSAAFERNAVSLAAEYLALDASSPELLAAAAETGPQFKTLSIHPVQTRASLVGLTSAVALMFCCGVLFQDKMGKLLLLIAISLIVTAVSTLGILQNISWNQWTLLEMPSTSGFATFISRNSAPQYFALGIGSTIGCIIAWLNMKRKKARSTRRYRATTALARLRRSVEDVAKEIDPPIVLLLVCVVLLIAGVVGAASRGGFVALLFALAVTMMLTLGRARRMVLPGLIGFSAIAFVLLFFLSAFELDEDIARRLELERLDSPARIEFWKLALSQPAFWLTGSGLGNFHFQIMPADKEFSSWIYHAESIYVELISEFGWGMAFVGLIGLGWLFKQLLFNSDSKHRLMWPAALYATLAIGLQSSVDFSLIIPSIFLTLAALVGTYLGESSREPRGNRASNSRRTNGWMVIGLSVGFLVMLWQGAIPLRGFAQGERLNALIRSGQEEPIRDRRLETANYDISHPEVLLQLARRKVSAAEFYLQQLPFWDEEVPPSQRERFSRLEFVSAVLRSDDLEFWGDFTEKWKSDQKLLQSIEVAHRGFDHMSRHCVFDWRGHWGLFQTSTEPDPLKLALCCARLRELTVSIPKLQQAVASCSLIAGDRRIGLDFWKTSLANHPKHTHRVASLVGPWLDAEDITFILPDSEIAKTMLVRSLHQRSEAAPMFESLVEQLNLAALIQEAETVDEWDLVVWLASLQDNSEQYIAGLKRIALLRPMDKAVRVRLARALEASGEIEEAIALLEQASRRSLLNAADERYLIQLKQANPPIRGDSRNVD